MSSVEPSRTNEAGGLQGTAQNLGASFGTALIGAILLGGLTAGFVDRVVDNPAIPPEVSAEIAQAAEATGLQIITVDQAEQYLLDAGLPADQAAAVAADYGQAQLDGLRNALGAVAVFAVLGFWFTRHLPGRAGLPVVGEAAASPPPTAAHRRPPPSTHRRLRVSPGGLPGPPRSPGITGEPSPAVVGLVPVHDRRRRATSGPRAQSPG